VTELLSSITQQEETMRFVIALLMALGFVASSTVAVPALVADSTYVAAAQQPIGEVDVDITTDGGGAWWAEPIWIGIGIVGLIALIAIIMAASRGGTTVVKD
jgi:hypothetical protein